MTERLDILVPGRSPLPDFDVQIIPPNLAPWLAGNIGVPAFASFKGPEPGPHVAIVALTHGNEIAGAVVLDRLLREQVRPARGTLTLGFNNIDAFARFDPAQPTASRYVDEDLNRVWDAATLDGPHRSLELDRARQIRPLIDRVDILLDLHSMLWPSDPLILCGTTEKGRQFAEGLAAPDLVVADAGHASGRRMVDYAHFSNPDHPAVANLVEAGQHWLHETVAMTEATVNSLLHHTGLVPQVRAKRPGKRRRSATVTHVISANSAQFDFVQFFHGGEVIPRRNTLIAMDGISEIRTPYDDCLLIMPSLHPTRGHTAVRLARFLV